MRSPFRDVPRTGVIYVMTEAARLGYAHGASGWANLGQGAPETGPLEGAPPRIGRVDLDEHTHEYSPVLGTLALRDAVAQLYNARYRRGMGSQYSAENVAIAGGGRVALTRLAAALGPVNLGHALPDYTAYEELLDVFHAFNPIPLLTRPEEGWWLSPRQLREAIVGFGLGAVLLSNPCNPTGQLVEGGDLAAWVSTCRNLGCALILDEFYSHYVYEGEAGRTVSAAHHVERVDEDPVVIVDGLTKNWRYPGWRLSWTLGPKELIERLGSAGSFLDGGPSHPLQAAALPLLDPALAAREARAIQVAFGEKRADMLTRAEDMGLRVLGAPQGAFYCFASLEGLPTPLNRGLDFFRAALQRQVIVVPGEFFDVDPGKRRGHLPSRLRPFVRLSFGPELETVRAGMDRLAALIAST